jgi:hypothetical protein
VLHRVREWGALGIALLALASRAAHADAPARVFAADTAAQPSCAAACSRSVSFAGPYAGAQLIGSTGTVSSTEYIAASGALFHHYDDPMFGAGLGGNLGYNWLPWSGWSLVGVVAHLNYQSDSGGRVLRTPDHLSASGQLRIGLPPPSDVLWFLQTGPAFAREHITVAFGAAVTDLERTVPGYGVGTGVEWALPRAAHAMLGWQRTLFLEIHHSWWNSNTLASPAAVPTLDLRWQRQSDKNLAGLRLYF